MKILIVDDDIVSRAKMLTIMKTFGDAIAVDCGYKAIEEFEHALHHGAGFDLVTLDINMPNMDGMEALRRLRRLERNNKRSSVLRSVIIMVTAQSDRHSVISCLQKGCNDYISKPFNADIISEKINKLGLLSNATEAAETADNKMQVPVERSRKEKIFESITLSLKNGDIHLPPLPQIEFKFRDLLKAQAKINEIAELLKQDMAIATQLISISNSVLNRGMEKNVSVEQAISRLGLSATEKLVNAMCYKRLYVKINQKYSEIVNSLWDHSLACAFASEVTVDKIKLTIDIDPFSLGLLHDVGKMILLQIIAEMEKRQQFSETISENDLNTTLIHYHGQFGAKLLANWKYPEPYIYCTLHHHNPNGSKEYGEILTLINFSNTLVKSIGYVYSGSNAVETIEQNSFAGRLGIGDEDIQAIKNNVNTRMHEMKRYFF